MRKVVPGIYRHFKGKFYRVVGTALHSETEEPHVVYFAEDGSLWVRPAVMFREEVERDGFKGSRFTLIEEKASPLETCRFPDEGGCRNKQA